MSFNNYVGKPFKSHVAKGVAVKYVYVNGIRVYPEHTPSIQDVNGFDNNGLQTTISDAFIHQVASKPYLQQWSPDQPSQHNTPVPVDDVNL